MPGGGKISMPPVVGVQIFSGTTQCLNNLFPVNAMLFQLCYFTNFFCEISETLIQIKVFNTKSSL